MRRLCLLLVLLVPVVLQAQYQVFTESQLLFYVRQYHPVAQQAKLQAQIGKAGVQQARGAFDPLLKGGLDQKEFDGKSYYRLLGAGLNVPTWYGVQLKGGLDQNSGAFLNPENKLPTGGLWYGGAQFSLAQGLIIDQRRAALKQAKLGEEMSVAEQRKMLNDLCFEAVQQYWKWSARYNEMMVFQQAVGLATERFNAVRQSYALGDEPAIDTLESFIQLQNLQLSKLQAEMGFREEGLKLSNYLWFEEFTPLEISDSLIPEMMDVNYLHSTIKADSLQVLIQNLSQINPEVKQYEMKWNIQGVDRRLKAEYLKPKIDLQYNFLTRPLDVASPLNISTQNYKWGLELSYPLFIRKARGEYKMARYKQEQASLDYQYKLWEAENKLKNQFQQHLSLASQINLYQSAVGNYFAMLEAEKRKFEGGESSVFLINSRQQKWVEARLKWIDLCKYFMIAKGGVSWAAGLYAPVMEPSAN